LRRASYVSGEYKNFVVLSILREEFESVVKDYDI